MQLNPSPAAADTQDSGHHLLSSVTDDRWQDRCHHVAPESSSVPEPPAFTSWAQRQQRLGHSE